MTALIRVVFLAAALIVAACVPTSEHPILTKGSTGDPALIGSWRGKMDDGAPVFMHFLKTKEGEISVLLVSQSGEKSEAEEGWAAFRIVTAEVKGTRYISALWYLNDGKPVEGREKGYHLMRYAVAPDGTLQLHGVNEEKLKEAVKAGKVEGTIEGEGTSSDVRLTAPSDKLVKFLKRANPADLFDKPFATLTKVPS